MKKKLFIGCALPILFVAGLSMISIAPLYK